MKVKKIHLIGIGGVGMAGLAVLLKSRGFEVSGCDLASTPRTRYLSSLGIAVAVGHDPAHVADVDEVIVTSAVDRANAEFAAAASRGLRVRRRGEVLAELVGERDSIAVCGSHGKTTTSTWIARLLKALGEDVAWCVGGETGDFPVAHDGAGPLVVEADESDGTLAHYRASTLVVNRLDYDHPDFFKTPADYFACFETAKAQAGTVIESETLPALGCASCIDALAAHNRRNARAAVEVALRRGHPLEKILNALPAVVAALPDRRFQRIHPVREGGGYPVYTDYAHHPVEMACAVAMARSICRGRLRVIFQPHRPSRTKALLAEFPTAFTGADEVVLCPTYMAFEPAIEGGDIADLYRECRERGLGGLFLARSCEEAWEHACNSMAADDLTLILGAGSIIDLVPRVKDDCAALAATGVRRRRPRRIFIGEGTNTWRSDLRLDVEYVRSAGPAGIPGTTLLADPALAARIPWMAGIPGTVGGWIKMNAGAFGHSFSEVLEAVKVDGAWLPAAACGFGYRTSAITGEIQDFRLRPDAPCDGGTPADFRARRKRFPAGTFGSFFKNPPGDFAGRLLEAAGAKDLAVGGAYVWREHANVIVRGEGATASDVLALARLMRERVRLRFGVALESEVCGISFG